MAYLKFTRDRRGYEHFALVQPTSRGKARPSLLYWFRTPPGIKVGRSPFDPEMRRALEAQNPAVVFDWDAITHTPIPPVVEPERWRERRHLERALRAASESEESASIPDAGEQPAQPEIHPASAIVAPTEESGGPAAATAQRSTPRQGHRRRRRRRGRRSPQVQGSGFRVPGSEAERSEPQKPTVQDSGEPGDENREP